MDFYFRFAYAVKRSQHKSHWLDCAWKHGYIRWIFPPAARVTRVMLETHFFTLWNLGVPFVSHQNLGDSKRYGKILLGFCSQHISRKSHGSVPKNSKQFWCSGAKTGPGGKLPPLATLGLTYCAWGKSPQLGFALLKKLVQSWALWAVLWLFLNMNGTQDATVSQIVDKCTGCSCQTHTNCFEIGEILRSCWLVQSNADPK